jgi:hypothetical protein
MGGVYAVPIAGGRIWKNGMMQELNKSKMYSMISSLRQNI